MSDPEETRPPSGGDGKAKPRAKKRPEQRREERRGGMRALAASLPGATRRAFGRRGLAEAGLIAEALASEEEEGAAA